MSPRLKLTALATALALSCASAAPVKWYYRVPAQGAQGYTPWDQPLYSFTGANFRNCGAVNNIGPTNAQCVSTYSGFGYYYAWSVDPSFFHVGSGSTQGYQYWTVPVTATYTFTLAGAMGADARQSGFYGGGYGAIIRGSLLLTKGTVLTIIVGQTPASFTGTNSAGGGGGGTFLYQGTTLLAAAGGGGGAAFQYGAYGAPNAGSGSTAGGTGGGISNGIGNGGGGGAGVNGDGTAAVDGSGVAAYPGLSFASGFTGGYSSQRSGWTAGAGYGGFGGGGGACSCSTGAGGGGGGYGGGNGGYYGPSFYYLSGQGGTSYLGPGNTFVSIGTNSGGGYVTVSAPVTPP